jgi:hypothetical protein
MKLYLRNVTLVVDTSFVNGEEPPRTIAEKIDFVKCAIGEANHNLLRKSGIRVEAFVEAGDIRSEA